MQHDRLVKKSSFRHSNLYKEMKSIFEKSKTDIDSFKLQVIRILKARRPQARA